MLEQGPRQERSVSLRSNASALYSTLCVHHIPHACRPIDPGHDSVGALFTLQLPCQRPYSPSSPSVIFSCRFFFVFNRGCQCLTLDLLVQYMACVVHEIKKRVSIIVPLRVLVPPS